MNRISIFLILFWILIPALILSISNDEEYNTLLQYKLPESAIDESALINKDSLMYKDGKPFTGIAYSNYENKQLKQVSQYKNGKKSGFMYVWYPDGKPQLLSNYYQGKLQGRFKGWYQFGDVIYDIMLSKGGFNSDQLFDTDTTREQVETSAKEGEADGLEKDND